MIYSIIRCKNTLFSWEKTTFRTDFFNYSRFFLTFAEI